MAGIPTHCAVLSTACSYDSGLMFISIRIPNGYKNNIPLLSESVLRSMTLVDETEEPEENPQCSSGRIEKRTHRP
jgi:hypothetical protein